MNNALDLNASFPDDFLSDQCGFDVTITISDAIDVTVIYDEAELVVQEIDATPAGVVTFSSAYGSSASYGADPEDRIPRRRKARFYGEHHESMGSRRGRSPTSRAKAR